MDYNAFRGKQSIDCLLKSEDGYHSAEQLVRPNAYAQIKTRCEDVAIFWLKKVLRTLDKARTISQKEVDK